MFSRKIIFVLWMFIILHFYFHYHKLIFKFIDGVYIESSLLTRK